MSNVGLLAGCYLGWLLSWLALATAVPRGKHGGQTVKSVTFAYLDQRTTP